MPIWRMQPGCYGWSAAAQFDQFVRPMTAQAGHWHAVDISRWRNLGRVEVRMRVQPQYAQIFAGIAAMIGDRGNRTHAQTMVATEQDRQTLGREFGADGAHDLAIPFDDLLQVPIAGTRRQPRIQGSKQIAAVGNLQATLLQRFGDTGHAQGFRAHRGPTNAGADVSGRADQRYGRKISHSVQSSISKPVQPGAIPRH